MWFEVNVSLSEVTDLKWRHGTEWQCGNSTVAMSWPNHVQILSFASMASRQGAVKHGFVSQIAGGCSSYDVIAPWPDLTWSIFLPKVAQGLPHKVPQNVAPPFFRYLRKTSGGGGLHQPPPLSGRGLNRPSVWSIGAAGMPLIPVFHPLREEPHLVFGRPQLSGSSDPVVAPEVLGDVGVPEDKPAQVAQRPRPAQRGIWNRLVVWWDRTMSVNNRWTNGAL